MLPSLLLWLLWSSVWVCHLNSLPPYRRKNPFHLPPAGPLQRSFCWLAPLLGLMGSYWLSGVEGLFLWAFTGPLAGMLIGLIIPLFAPAPHRGKRNDASSDTSSTLPHGREAVTSTGPEER